MPTSRHAGDVLADRYRLDDLLAEARGGRFWRAHDVVLHRPVAIHIIAAGDPRADELLATARRVAPLSDRRVLRVLDAERTEDLCYVVNEWGRGDSLDILVSREGPLAPRRAAWIVAEVAEGLATAHALDVAHGRLVPENVMIDHHGHVKLIGLGVDAALRGLPPGRISADVTDTVALLYFLLTGTWPGVSLSTVRPAPLANGLPLRPRQVRAGIPRQLDALCDEVLNPTAHVRSIRTEHDLATVAGIDMVLREYLGDYLGEPPPGAPAYWQPPEPEPEAPPAPTRPAAASTPVDEPTEAIRPDPNEGDTADAPDASERAESTDSPASAASPEEDGDDEAPSQATQAGMPVFHDDSDDVGWMRARSTPPTPPPALLDPEPKPLFAPDPPEGQPVRRPRPGTAAAAAAAAVGDTDAVRRSPGGRDYWPWQSDTDSQGSGSWQGAAWDTHGSGSWETDTSERVPGRSWIRLAMLVGAAAVLLVLAVAAYQLRWAGLGPADDDTDDRPGTQRTATRDLVDFEGLTATDFDPQGSPPQEENPELAPLAVDGDTATAWRTATYRQNFGPGGLKTGVGLIVDLGATRGVRQVAVAVEGETTLSAYVTSEAPTGVRDLTAVGTTSGNGVITVTLDEAVSGRFVTVWLTAIPQVDDGFRGTVAEIQVKG